MRRSSFLLCLFLAAGPGTSPASGQPCPEAKAADFTKQVLISGSALSEPLEMAVSRGGMVFIAQRFGELLVFDPATRKSALAGKLDVYSNTGTGTVGGLLGVAVSAGFPDKDEWVYLYYAPRSRFNGSANNVAGRLSYHLSRFRFLSGKLEPASEQVLLEVKAIWETHNAGSLKFGRNGDLYLSTGDNRNPACSDQYSPMDERPGRAWCDGQETTANTNDLRGKVLRIHPEPALVEGRYYSIPKGNLRELHASLWSAGDLAKVRPEIYTMGHRNPFRIFPDPVTGKLLIAEFGPAAPSASDRGPAGADQLKITDEAAFLGYPYFLKDNRAYCHWDYEMAKCKAIPGQAGLRFDPARPVNSSPNNTGVSILPPARPAALWEHDGTEADPIEGLATCGFGAGPVYHFDRALDSKVKFPIDFDNKWLFFATFAAGWQPKLAAVPDGYAPIRAVASPPWGNLGFSPGLLDMEYGPGDGALYVVDYGAVMYNRNADAGVYRITYDGCLPPVSIHPGSRTKQAFALVTTRGPEQEIGIPPGAKGLRVYSMAGERIWSAPVDGRVGRVVRLPADQGRGMVRLLWD